MLNTLSSRNDKDLCETRIIIRKEERGNDAITRKKTRDKVVKALEPKISAGNLSRILTSADIAEYDVAAEALSWQSTLKDIRKFCVQYDMMAILLIPQNVDLSAPDVVAKARTFKNAIDDWKTLDDKDYFEWQEFILRYGSFEDTTSDNWLDNVLLLSMEKTLRAEVESDMTSIPKKQHGSIATLRCIIKRMVIKNQEAKDALENYIRNFDITKFPGENVPIACLCLNAVARALGNEDLPSNTIQKVLEGFGTSSTKTFNDFCSSQIALRRGSIYSDIMIKSSLQSQLSILLGDIEATYIDLVGGNKWEGITASPPASSFLASPSVDDAEEEENARTLAAKADMPWDEWVKRFAECHYCGKKGHIRPDCPEYIKKIASGEIKKPLRPPRTQARPNYRRAPPPARRPTQKNQKDPKMKAFLSAFNALFDDNDDDTPSPDNDDDGSAGDENNDTEMDEDVYNFLAKVGCLKD